MGRNKNKDNRSVARRSNGISGQGNSKRDSGLPAFFKHRRTAGLPKSALPQSVQEQRDDMDLDQGNPSTTQRRTQLGKQKNNDSFLLEKAAVDLSLSGKRDNSAKAFMKDVKNVIENSDVILQVLDARDPLGSRSRSTELMAMGSGKKVVLILNKVDLISTANLQGWLKYLRHDFPTLAFKASTQLQRGNLKQGKATFSLLAEKNGSSSNTNLMSFGSEAVGATALLQLLKNYARTSAKGSNLKQQLTVGIIGPPNVGKSSLINSLLRTRACAVASTPGWTKVVQGVMLEKGIRLLDCPGVAIAGQDDYPVAGKEDDSQLSKIWSALRNTVKVELLEDPITPVQALLTKVAADELSKLYNIEGGFNEGDAHDFLLRVALMRGKLGKGGIPDLEGAARIVLHDWNTGRISYQTPVPTMHPSGVLTGEGEAEKRDQDTAGTSLVSNFGEAFDLQALLGEADAEALGGVGGASGIGGKDLLVARERRILAEADDRESEPVEEENGDLSESKPRQEGSVSYSLLGKRGRMQDPMDSDYDSDADDDDREFSTALKPQDNDDSDDEKNSARPIANAPTSQSEYADRKQQKAESMPHRKRELLSVFSEHELHAMAQRRGDVRRAAKKKKKRLQRSEAGLVDVWESGLHLPTDEGGNLNPSSIHSPRGIFDVPELPSDTSVQHEEEEEL